MKQWIHIMAAILLSVILFTGCAFSAVPVEKSEQQASQSDMEEGSRELLEEAEEGAEASILQDEEEQGSDNDVSNDRLEVPDLSLLTEEQQNLYHQAEGTEIFLFAAGVNIGRPYPQFQTEYCQLIDGDIYMLYQNSYEEFSDLMCSIFTKDYLESLGTDYEKKFLDHDGQLAISRENEVHWSKENSLYGGKAGPDTYRLESESEDEVYFSLIAHYKSTDEEPDEFTVEYPIHMLRTENGWRIDEFHTSAYG